MCTGLSDEHAEFMDPRERGAEDPSGIEWNLRRAGTIGPLERPDVVAFDGQPKLSPSREERSQIPWFLPREQPPEPKVDCIRAFLTGSLGVQSATPRRNAAELGGRAEVKNITSGENGAARRQGP